LRLAPCWRFSVQVNQRRFIHDPHKLLKTNDLIVVSGPSEVVK
jgi:hypothetical protein